MATSRYPVIALSLFAALHAAAPRIAADTLRLTLADATRRALANNPGLAIQRDAIGLAEQAAERARGAYDVVVRLDARVAARTDPVNSLLSGAPGTALAPRQTTAGGTASVSRLFENGASLAGSVSMSRDTSNSLFALLSPFWLTSVGVELRQPFMRGRVTDEPRRAIRVAAVERSRSVTTVERAVSDLVAAVERSYWTLVAARRTVEVRGQAIELAEQQRDDTRVRIEAGVASESDLAAPEAEIERRRLDLHAAREAVQRAEHALKSLMLPSYADPAWSADIEPLDRPEPARFTPDLPAALSRATNERPEVREALQRVERQDIDIEGARDRLKPVVDLVAHYAVRGLAGGENRGLRPPFPMPVLVHEDLTGTVLSSWANAFAHRFADASLGVNVAVPLGNRAAKADLASARLARRQALSSVDQVRMQVATEVRDAAVAVTTAVERIDAARASRAAAAIQLQAERDRFEAGVSSNFLVLTRQNDMTAALAAETAALAEYRKALTEYARAAGSLLADRGIEAAPVSRP